MSWEIAGLCKVGGCGFGSGTREAQAVKPRKPSLSSTYLNRRPYLRLPFYLTPTGTASADDRDDQFLGLVKLGDLLTLIIPLGRCWKPLGK